MAYFNARKIESQPDRDAEARWQELRDTMQRVVANGEPNEELWHYLLSKAGCPELYDVGESLSQVEITQRGMIIKCLEQFSYNHDWNIRDSVARVLATMLDRRAEPTLRRLLTDPEEALVCYAALKALWNIGCDFTQEEKAKLLSDESDMVSWLAGEFFNSQ